MATDGDFAAIDPDLDAKTLAEQWAFIARAVQGLAAMFRAKIVADDEEASPDDDLSGLGLIRAGGTLSGLDWRFQVDEDNAFLIEQNIGPSFAPDWVVRLMLAPGVGLQTAPPAHTHDAEDVATGEFPDNRIAASAVKQHSLATPAPGSIPKALASGALADGWISETAVTQHQGALELAAEQIIVGTFPDDVISQSSVVQYRDAVVGPIAFTSVVAPGSAPLVNVGGFSTHEMYTVEVLVAVASAALLFLRVSPNADGSSPYAGATDYSYTREIVNSATTPTQQPNDSLVPLFVNSLRLAGRCTGRIFIDRWRPSGISNPGSYIRWDLMITYGAGLVEISRGGCNVKTAGVAIQSIQVFTDGPIITAASFALKPRPTGN